MCMVMYSHNIILGVGTIFKGLLDKNVHEIHFNVHLIYSKNKNG